MTLTTVKTATLCKAPCWRLKEIVNIRVTKVWSLYQTILRLEGRDIHIPMLNKVTLRGAGFSKLRKTVAITHSNGVAKPQ